VSRPACTYWRAQAKEHGTTYGRLINTATGLPRVREAPASRTTWRRRQEYRRSRKALATEMAPYGGDGEHDHAGGETHASAQIGWRMGARGQTNPTTPRGSIRRDPVHVGEFRRVPLVAGGGVGSRARRFQVRGGTVEHIETWSVRDTAHAEGRGFTADDYLREIPRLFGGGARNAPIRPPPGWKAK